MHLAGVTVHVERFPPEDCYPFCLPVFRATGSLQFKTPVTFFIGENGTGKSTLLKAVARQCRIHIWNAPGRRQLNYNRYTEELHRYVAVEWAAGPVPGSFFASEIFQEYAQLLDEWASADPGMLKYFGGESLVTKSHGQCNMAYFKNRYRIKGLYLLDEPETALSPRRQLELLTVLQEMGAAGHAQFIIATHSPILLALPGAVIYSFNHVPVTEVEYEQTEYYTVYKDFLNYRHKYLQY